MIADRRTTANPFDSQDFREEFKNTISETLKPVVDMIDKHDKAIANNAADIEEHKRKFREQKGAMWAFGICGTAVVTMFEGALHYFGKKG